MATVRRATLSDADAIGRVHVRAWQAAYRGVMPDDFLDGLDPGQRADRWRDWLRAPPADQELLVAVDAGAVVGFALVGPVQGGSAELGELLAINLTPEAWGRGTGSALLARAEQELVARRYRSAVLWVARDNERARGFYEHHGWTARGETRTEDLARRHDRRGGLRQGAGERPSLAGPSRWRGERSRVHERPCPGPGSCREEMPLHERTPGENAGGPKAGTRGARRRPAGGSPWGRDTHLARRPMGRRT